MTIEKRTVSLPSEHAAFIDQMVASGSFASASEVVRAGLRALQERNDAVERWLRDEVAATYDRVKVDPDSLLTSEQVFDAVRSHHANKLKGDS